MSPMVLLLFLLTLVLASGYKQSSALPSSPKRIYAYTKDGLLKATETFSKNWQHFLNIL